MEVGEEEQAEEEGGEVKVAGYVDAAETDVEDEDGDENEDEDDDEDENEEEEEEGKRCEMMLFPERWVTSALFPPLRSSRDRWDSYGWRHSR